MGNTPLGLALLRGHITFAVLLINAGASMKQNVVRNANKAEDCRLCVPARCVAADGANVSGRGSTLEEGMESVSVFYHLLSRNDIGLAYLAMDMDADISTCMRDVLATARYQLVLTLLNKASSERIKAVTQDTHQSLLHVLAACYPQTVEARKTFIDAHASLTIAEALLEEYGLDATLQDKEGNTPLHLAARSLNTPLVERLVEIAPELLLTVNHAGVLPVFMPLTQEDINAPGTRVLEVFSVLLQATRKHPRAASVPLAEKGDELRLIIGATKRLVAAMRAPVAPAELGPAGGAVDGEAKTREAPRGAPEVAELDAPADVSTETDTAAAAATDSIPAALVARLQGEAGALFQLLVRLLSPASQGGVGLSPNVCSSEDGAYTALMYAVAVNSTEGVMALLDACKRADTTLDLNARDARGETAVHALFTRASNSYASPENVELLRLLAASGADVTLADAAGRTPLKLARQQASGRMDAALLDLTGRGTEVAPAAHGRPTSSLISPAELAPVMVDEDASLALEELTRQSTSDAAGPSRPAVGPVSKLETLAEVVSVSPAGAPATSSGFDPLDFYDATLLLVDVTYGYRGRNMF
jgi:ankyrin repeat protein